VTGLTFTAPTVMRFENFADSRGLRALDLTVCYSLEGPPYLELVQWDLQGGVFGSQHGEGLHHIGFHDGDVPARQSRLESEQGVRIAARRFGNRRSEVLHSILSEPADLHGVRLEIVDEKGRLALEEWLGSVSP
jgi:hypothetical protein